MINGITLKDDIWDERISLKNGTTLLLMGSRDEDLVSEPAKTEQPKIFVEDLHPEVSEAIGLPKGLINLGNTCYMNATVQCLRTVPELRSALSKWKIGSSVPGYSANSASDALLATGLKDCFKNLDGVVGIDSSNQSYSPQLLLAAMHRALPHFATKMSDGNFAQQDANECWTEIMRMLQSQLMIPAGTPDEETDVITRYFRGSIENTFKCMESEEEASTKSKESFLQLSCYISQDTKYLQLGLQNRFKPEVVAKRSQSLERNANFTRTSLITRLPAYMTIQFVRFHYKEKERINAKILRDVSFPLRIDMHEFCSPEMQKKMKEFRDKMADQEGNDKIMKQVSFDNDPGSNGTGLYDLQAVLTHKGRSSSSGHYVAWISPRADPGSVNAFAKTDWFEMNDDRVSHVHEDDVKKLSGGGDWHCAYVLLYGPIVN
jgi:ubiquitin carboxyl-terminal hydrolase 14